MLATISNHTHPTFSENGKTRARSARDVSIIISQECGAALLWTHLDRIEVWWQWLSALQPSKSGRMLHNSPVA
jgi:hypothetical protein